MKHYFTRTNVAVLILTFICGIVVFSISLHRNRSRFPNSFVMKYSDFVPQGSSYELPGTNSRQEDYQASYDTSDVKVVIYRNVDLATVKRTYPVIAGKSDYRYIEYSEAIAFLEKRIEELRANNDRDTEYVRLKEQLISEYEQTRAKIIERFGD